MREAVTIILERMKSHPEEFEEGGKFWWVEENLDVSCLTEDERQAVTDAFKTFEYKQFHDRVMRSLLAQDANEEYTGRIKYDAKLWKPSPALQQKQMITQHMKALIDAQNMASQPSGFLNRVGKLLGGK